MRLYLAFIAVMVACGSAYGLITHAGDITILTQYINATGFNVTDYSLNSTGYTVGVNTSAIQKRVVGTCGAGSSIRVIAEDGTVTCETDDAGAGSYDLNVTSDAGSTNISDNQVLSIIGGGDTTTAIVGTTLTITSTDSTDDSVDSGELDNLCSDNNRILLRAAGTWGCYDYASWLTNTTMNTSIDWSDIANIPAGFADGIDNQTAGSGGGNTTEEIIAAADGQVDSKSWENGTSNTVHLQQWDARVQIGTGDNPTANATLLIKRSMGTLTPLLRLEAPASNSDPFISFWDYDEYHYAMGIDASDSHRFKITGGEAVGPELSPRNFITLDYWGNMGIYTDPTEPLIINASVNITAGNDICIKGGPCLTTAGNTTEEMQDAVMAAIDDGTQTHITVTYEDATNDMDFVVSDDWYDSCEDVDCGFYDSCDDTDECGYWDECIDAYACGWWSSDDDISADEISESKINFTTSCPAGNHLYINGNDLGCEAEGAGSGNTSQEMIDATTGQVNSTSWEYLPGTGIYLAAAASIKDELTINADTGTNPALKITYTDSNDDATIGYETYDEVSFMQGVDTTDDQFKLALDSYDLGTLYKISQAGTFNLTQGNMYLNAGDLYVGGGDLYTSNIRTSSGALWLFATTYAAIQTGAGQDINFDLGDLLSIRDQDSGDAVRVTIDSANGDIVTVGDFQVEEIHMETDTANHYIEDNSTCTIIHGDTSTLSIC